MGNFYRVPADNRGLNYDKFFKEGETNVTHLRSSILIILIFECRRDQG
nr:hypothetical protein [Bacteroides thetaiotaomicron]